MQKNLILCNLCEWTRNLCIKLVIIKKGIIYSLQIEGSHGTEYHGPSLVECDAVWFDKYSNQPAASFFRDTFRYICTGLNWITQRKTLNSTHVLSSLWCCTVGHLMTTHLLSNSSPPLSLSFCNNDKDFTSWGKPHIKSLFVSFSWSFFPPC